MKEENKIVNWDDHLDKKYGKNRHKAYFASGCFWGTEYGFMKVNGVKRTSVGFMGGHVDHPTYGQDPDIGSQYLSCLFYYEHKGTQPYCHSYRKIV
jgi:peptide methionine sulfoxide reductase MsrA